MKDNYLSGNFNPGMFVYNRGRDLFVDKVCLGARLNRRLICSVAGSYNTT